MIAANSGRYPSNIRNTFERFTGLLEIHVQETIKQE
jgi:hypothetical protein